MVESERTLQAFTQAGNGTTNAGHPMLKEVMDVAQDSIEIAANSRGVNFTVKVYARDAAELDEKMRASVSVALVHVDAIKSKMGL